MAVREIDALPGPKRLPLIGNAHQARADKLHLVAEEWCDRYGPVYKFDIVGRRVLTVGDAEPINTVLRDRPDGFRRWQVIRRNLAEMLGTPGVFGAEGDEWRGQRRLAVTALNSNHLQRYFRIVATCTDRLHSRLTAVARSGRDCEIGELLSAFTVDVTSSPAFGVDLNTLERGDNELQRHLHRIFDGLSRRLVVPFPYWHWVKLPADRALDRSVAEVDREVRRFMEQTRQRIAAKPELREAPENFLEGMIASQESDGGFSDAEIVANVFTLLLAGEDTTSHTLAWTLWSLATHPELQDRCAEEAVAVLGDRLFPEQYETVAELRFGEAALRETERAMEFDPDRWLEDGGERAPGQRAFLTFGAGPRFCPGRNLAFLEANTALAMIVRNFEVELAPDAGPVVEHFGFSMSPRGLRVRLRARADARRGSGSLSAMARPARCHRIAACRSLSGTSRRTWRTSDPDSTARRTWSSARRPRRSSSRSPA